METIYKSARGSYGNSETGIFHLCVGEPFYLSDVPDPNQIDVLDSEDFVIEMENGNTIIFTDAYNLRLFLGHAKMLEHKAIRDRQNELKKTIRHRLYAKPMPFPEKLSEVLTEFAQLEADRISINQDLKAFYAPSECYEDAHKSTDAAFAALERKYGRFNDLMTLAESFGIKMDRAYDKLIQKLI